MATCYGSSLIVLIRKRGNMLICSECGKVIANTNPSVHYGICSSCPIPHREDKIEREPTTADEYNDEWLEEQRKDKK